MTNQTCIVFKISSQKYCVDILKIKEISTNQNTIILPNTPSFIEGVINLRGDVLCIINLAKKLGMSSLVDKKEQKIVVINIEELFLGFLVDDVLGIIHITEDDFNKTPEMVSNDSDFVEGIIKSDEDMIILLDLKKVLTQTEINTLEQLNKEQVI